MHRVFQRLESWQQMQPPRLLAAEELNVKVPPLSRLDRAFLASRSFVSLQHARQCVSLAHTKLLEVAHAELVEVQHAARGGGGRAAELERQASAPGGAFARWPAWLGTTAVLPKNPSLRPSLSSNRYGR